ncbi:MAG: 50S ribosomal protein L9 [Candidatus Paceibacterota bacterium]
MKIILLKDVAKLGRKYDLKDVASGHALNLLIPQGLAIAATPEAKKRIEVLKASLEGERKVQADLLNMNLKSLEDVMITVSGKANEKGHLFAGLHAEAIATELFKQTQIQVEPSMIVLDQPIKEVGEHLVEVKLNDKSAKFKLVIEAVK